MAVMVYKEERLNGANIIYSLDVYDTYEEAEAVLIEEKKRLQKEGWYSFNVKKKRGKVVYVALTDKKRGQRGSNLVLLKLKRIPSFPQIYTKYAEDTELFGGLRLQGGKAFKGAKQSIVKTFKVSKEEQEYLNSLMAKLGVNTSDLVRFALWYILTKEKIIK